MSIEEKVKELQEEIRNTKYNKATQHHIGLLKAKIARLKEESEKRASSGAPGKGYSVKKAGDASVVLVGFPSVGKSTLLNLLTNANSEVGAYEFTTLDVIPGIMEYRGAKIQVLDLPGIIKGAASGKGRGREILAVIRSADLVVFMVDVFNVEQFHVLENELYEANMRLDQKPPNLKISIKERGGITINSTVEITNITERNIKGILSEYRMHNADVVLREDITPEQLIDAIMGNRLYVPSFVVLNKIDLVNPKYLEEAKGKIQKEFLPISADNDIGIDELKEIIYKKLDFIRLYMKPQGEKADMEEPMIIRQGTTVEEVCMRLHRDFKDKFRFGLVWGKSAKFDGQRVGLDHVFLDEDIVSIVVKK